MGAFASGDNRWAADLLAAEVSMCDLDQEEDDWWARDDEDESDDEPLRRDVGGEGVRQ